MFCVETVILAEVQPIGVKVCLMLDMDRRQVLTPLLGTLVCDKIQNFDYEHLKW